MEECIHFTEILLFLIRLIASSDDVDRGIDELSLSYLLLESWHEVRHDIGIDPDNTLDLLVTHILTHLCRDTLTALRSIECLVIEPQHDITIEIGEAEFVRSDPAYRCITIDWLRP